MSQINTQNKYAQAVSHLDVIIEQIGDFVYAYDATDENVIAEIAIYRLIEQGLKFNSIGIEKSGIYKGKVYAFFYVPDYRDSMR